MLIWRILSLILLVVPASLSVARADNLVYEGTEGVGKGKHIVLIANDHEYRSEQTCPALARILAKRFGFRCTVLFGLDQNGDIKAGAENLPGLEVLKEADLVFFFTRFMKLPDDQADLLVDYFERGGPVVGIRTSTHCFNGQQGKWEKLNYNFEGETYRGGLGEQIFGNTWNAKRGQSHYGSNHKMGCRLMPAMDAKSHPILRGIRQIHAYSGAYKSQPPADAFPLLDVQVLNTLTPSEDLNLDKPIVNAGWTRDHYTAPSGKSISARVVYTSFGASEDLLDEQGRRFMVNACLWAGGWEDGITPDSDVSLVGPYQPSFFANGIYYGSVKPTDLAGWDVQIMPAEANLVGASAPEFIRTLKQLLENRPAMRLQLSRQFPELQESAGKSDR